MQSFGIVWILATLLPLAAFLVEILFGRFLKRATAYVGTAAIFTSFLLSSVGMLWFISFNPGAVTPPAAHASAHDSHGETSSHAGDHGESKPTGAGPHGTNPSEMQHAGHDHSAQPQQVAHGNLAWATVIRGSEGGVGHPVGVRIGYLVDNLTALMFCMVTLIATCIHVYSMSYMEGEERFHRFFAFLSLFCFSMLALVISDNFFQTFICWELVGVCSYFLIGFYYEKRSASNAANKAFITNRVGDVGFIIGLMAIYANFGTFGFDEIFPNGQLIDAPISPLWLTIAGIGIFVGCVGKSAQFPLHVWLPDAMEGPTPVSALIHAATMVAAGVFFTARVFPLFTPEALLVIAYVGGITLFVAATIAIVATDIKKALAYSTVSQLGYMIMALGIGGWVAGLMHLITHAFFKALLFLCSGSVIHGTGTQEMPQMGGLYKKMPYTAITMLIGVLAIAGCPFFSGFYSKDAIIAHVLAYGEANPEHTFLLILPALSAGVTSFYMFRLWFMTFVGTPRDHHVYDHAHESPPMMYIPLMVLAFFAIFAAGMPYIPFLPTLESYLNFAAPAVLETGDLAGLAHRAHELHGWASLVASGSALFGASLAYAVYCRGVLNPDDARRQFSGIYDLLVNKWYFDELYKFLFVRPALSIARMCAWIDKNVIDGLIHATVTGTLFTSRINGLFDLGVVDGLVNLMAKAIHGGGVSLRAVQTGWLRGYVLAIAVGSVGLFIVGSFLFG